MEDCRDLVKQPMSGRIADDSYPKLSSGSFWKDIRDAIQGTKEDYTSIGINKAVMLLAVPMMLELVMESTFAIARSVENRFI
jgi:hypothetical protein